MKRTSFLVLGLASAFGLAIAGLMACGGSSGGDNSGKTTTPIATSTSTDTSSSGASSSTATATATGSTTSTKVTGPVTGTVTVADVCTAKSKDACTPGSFVDCKATCGPNKAGAKVCTCDANKTPAQVSCGACSYDSAVDYSCYKIPATPEACDAAGPVTGGAPCDRPACKACGGGGGGVDYQDSSGAPKSGYCVCVPLGTATSTSTSTGKWSCASNNEWPCVTGSTLPGC